MNRRQKDKIVNAIITEMYSNTKLHPSAVGEFVALLNRMDSGIGYSPYMKSVVVDVYFKAIHSQDKLAFTCEQHDRFIEKMRAVYLQ